MTNLPTLNETLAAEGMAACFMNGLTASKTEHDSFENWVATLTRLAEQHERAERLARERETAYTAKPPLEKVPEGPFRSLGGYFDYTHWADRERFMELDRAIAAGQELS